MEKLGAEAFAFVNFARFAVPLRIGLALSTTGWIQNNVVDRFMKKESEPICADEPGLQSGRFLRRRFSSSRALIESSRGVIGDSFLSVVR